MSPVCDAILSSTAEDPKAVLLKKLLSRENVKENVQKLLASTEMTQIRYKGKGQADAEECLRALVNMVPIAKAIWQQESSVDFIQELTCQCGSITATSQTEMFFSIGIREGTLQNIITQIEDSLEEEEVPRLCGCGSQEQTLRRM
jgi:hypothetical protein